MVDFFGFGGGGFEEAVDGVPVKCFLVANWVPVVVTLSPILVLANIAFILFCISFFVSFLLAKIGLDVVLWASVDC